MIGNDLETSKVPLSVLFCIIEKNAHSTTKVAKYSQKTIYKSTIN